MKEKDKRLETLRVLAIILVIALHVTSDDILVNSGEVYRFLGYLFMNIRMPMFTVISGYLYGMHSVAPGAEGRFVKGKVRRLIVPLFFVSSAEFLCKALLPIANGRPPLSDYWSIHFSAYGHYWFIQALFVIFMLMLLLAYLKLDRKLTAILVLFACSLALFLLQPSLPFKLDLFSINYATYLFPFFLVGYLLGSYPALFDAHKWRWAIAITLVCLLMLQLLFWLEETRYLASQRSIVGLLVGLSSCIVFIRCRFVIPLLYRIGPYVFTIYLFQEFGMSIGRRLCSLLGVEVPLAYFISVITITLLFGVCTHKSLEKIPVIKTLCLGLKTDWKSLFKGYRSDPRPPTSVSGAPDGRFQDEG